MACGKLKRVSSQPNSGMASFSRGPAEQKRVLVSLYIMDASYGEAAIAAMRNG